MASVGARAYNGGLGVQPSVGSRGIAPGQGGRICQILVILQFIQVLIIRLFGNQKCKLIGCAQHK